MQEILKALSIDPRTILTVALGFVILYFLFRKYGTSPVFAMLDERQANIRATYDQLDLDRKNMEQARLEYERRLANIEAEAREQIQAAIKEAQGLRDNMLADARAQVEAILDKGRLDSQREREKAFMEMRQQIVALAIGAAGKVIGTSMDPATHTALVDNFIDEVGRGGSALTRGQGGTAA